jgi:hypothetical protein
MDSNHGCTVDATQALAVGSPSLPVLLAGLGSVCLGGVVHVFATRGHRGRAT